MFPYSDLKRALRRIFSGRQIGSFLILFIGLALASIMFAIGYGYSSSSLPYKDAEQLVVIGRQSINSSGTIPFLINAEPFFEWKEQKNLLSDVAIFKPRPKWRVRTSNGNISFSGIEATNNFFDVLGVSFPGHEGWKQSVGTLNLDTLALTYKLGMKEFGYSEIGNLYRAVDGGGVIVGGILPASFALPRQDMSGNTKESGIVPVLENEFSSSGGTVIARLAPGITPQIVEQVLASKPDEEAMFWGKIVVMPLKDAMTRSLRPNVWGSWGLCLLVLLLCSANLSGILLVRCSYQLREYATCTAFGARFLDLIRPLLIELTVMATVAAIMAGIVGRTIIAFVNNALPVKYLSLGRPSWGWEVVVFLIMGTIVVICVSVAATIVVIGRNYHQGFSREMWAVFYGHRWMRMFLTSGQTAIAMLLLSTSYIAVRGYLDMFNRDVGVDTNVRIVSVFHESGLSESAMGSMVQNTLNALNGGDVKTHVAAYSGALFDGLTSITNFTGESPIKKYLKPEEFINLARVSSGFFKVVKAKILAGREFNSQDDGGVLINATFARRMGWLPQEAIGQLLSTNTIIIGVVDDILVNSLSGEVPLTLFRQLRSQTPTIPINYIAHPNAIQRIDSMERVIMQIDPEAVITRNVSWRELLGESVRSQTVATFSVVVFTITAILIVVIGIASTITFIIARRTREIAIHIAIGAEARHVCWFIVSDMVKAGIVGIIAGGVASWWISKIVASFIYQGERYQNFSGLMIVAFAMILIIAITSLIPALRALRIAPSRALQME